MTILATKIFFPAVRPASVARPRLVGQLDSGLHRRLALISAPAGSGKTSLMAEWRAGRGSKMLAAWLSLDPADNDALRFLTYFNAALESAVPDWSPAITALLQSPQPPPVEGLASALLEALSNLSVELVLVLDDYHLITNLQIHRLLNDLLSHPYPAFHLAILTRADPPLPLGRLRVRNELAEIRAGDLRFTLEEVAAFLFQTMGLSLPQESIASLEARTEGWIAGLQLAALSMQGREDRAAFVAAFTGSHHYVVDYLVDEVLSIQPEKMRDFLLKTSILERMNGPLCNALTGESDGQVVLEELDRANLFVSALDDERSWYRYHHLFGDMLQNRLHQVDADAIREYHHRAAAWFEPHGFLSEAVAHELAAQNWELAAKLVERNSSGMLMRGEMRTLLQWMDAIDPVLHQNASLCIAKAWALAFTNRSEVMEVLLQETAALIAGDAGSPLWGDIAALRAYLAGVSGEARDAIAFGREALERLPESNIIVRGVVNLSLGGAYWTEGHLEACAVAFEQAARIGLKVGSAHLATTALCGLSNRCAALGELHRAREYCERALQASQGKDGKNLPTAGDACVNLGNLFYEWNDLPAAEEYLEEGIRLVRLLGRISTLADGQISLARVRLAQGELEQAADLLNEAQRHQQSTILHPAINAHLAVAKMALYLRMGDINAASRFAKQCDYALDHPLTYHNSMEYVQFGHFLLAGKDAARASLLAGNLMELAAAQGWIDMSIRAGILQARALAEQGQTRQALRSMEQAVNLAQPEGYMRAFLDPGEAVKKILSSMMSGDGIHKNYVFQLVAAFGETSTLSQERLIEPEAQTAKIGLFESLSARELEVLRLVALGKSNQQIAAELVLATGTVKKHLNNIFGKLAVQNRTECVVRARELNLL